MLLYRYTAAGGGESGLASQTIICAVLLDWPSNNTVTLGALSSTHVSTIEMLGLNGKGVVIINALICNENLPLGVQLKFSSVSDGLLVNLPVIPPSSDLKRAWTLKITSTSVANRLL